MITNTRMVTARPRYSELQHACRQLQRPRDSEMTTLSRFFRRKLKFLESYFSVLSLLAAAWWPTNWKSLSVSSPENVGEADFRLVGGEDFRSAAAALL